ncbi:hypothetical protein [Alcanivorax sp.]|uniref:hypothetical protein n=1 Tax=Alcanivorax sp. TaxID=1872427 RepID=UPI003A90D53B
MSRVKTTPWMTAFSLAALTSAAHGDNTQAEIRRLQSELDQLKSRLGDEPTDPALNWPSLKVFGSVSVDAIYDAKDAGFLLSSQALCPHHNGWEKTGGRRPI